MEAVSIVQDSDRYPADLRRLLRASVPNRLIVLGDAGLLDSKPVALFCSRRCPGDLILRTYDLAHEWRDAGVAVISGFHSPMEQECLRILLRGSQPVIICPARGPFKRVPPTWRAPLRDGRLLIVHAFDEDEARTTAELAKARNRVVAALADRIFVAHAEPGSGTERFCREIVEWGKPLCTLDKEREAIANLTRPGCERPVKAG